VKIRGTAAHIAEKYMSLARDALASGDMVTAESYLQHAEHYNRIIMAAQQQFGGQPNAHQGEGPNGGGGYRQPARWNADEEGDDEGAEQGGGDIRAGSGGGNVQGGGGQDRERQAGNREHHPGGREGGGREGGGRDRGRHGGNGHEAGRGDNGADQPETAATDDTTSDQVS
jgi:hypothetical protein